MKKLASIIIRTLNEEKYLFELLDNVSKQSSQKYDFEIVVIDSGSTDKTLDIAKKFKSRITYIDKKEFTFGRSLNRACEFANGDFLIFISGHCIPINNNWIEEIIRPIDKGICDYSYGKQVARDTTKFSERQLFDKYFPDESNIPQEGIFCNNANSAISKTVWMNFRFDEELTGCEDMELAKRLVLKGGKVGYVASAPVYHIHDESWSQVIKRYERESLALQKIFPEVHLNIFNVINFIVVGVMKDFRAAIRMNCLISNFKEIILFRFSQYYGAYKGNNLTKSLSNEVKQKYFYPRVTNMNIKRRNR